LFKGKVITPGMAARFSSVFSNRCDLTIAPSIKIKKLLEGYGVTKPVDVLATGVKVSDYSKKVKANNFRQQYGLKPNDKLLIFVGRLGKEKNVDFLISAMPLIQKTIKNAKLIIIGDGPHRANLQKQAINSGIKESVIFTGYFKKLEVVKAYQSSDIFVFASLTDTQGMVVVEAAAAGLPIVAVKDDAFGEFLRNGQNGFNTQRNKKDFSDKVVKILSKKTLYNKMSKKSQEIAREFTIEKQTKKLVGIYRKLM
jgi:1,2-diacylglycerol 3-alpha-glucosyltransferase